MTLRSDRFGFLLLASLATIYVLLRAIMVPITHDETTSFLAYAQPGTFLPFRSMWDANNHFLNSACGWLGYSVAGLHLLALRWASVAAFALFAWSAWRIGNRLEHRGVRWCLWFALLLCPLVIEYFSLFRGYGPALAFLLFALECMMAYAAARDRRSLLLALSALVVANGFVLALVPLWTIALVLLATLAKGHRQHGVFLLVMGAVPWAAAVGYSFLMSHFGLLYHGSTGGFVEATVGSLAIGVFGTTDPVVVGVMLVATLGGIGLLAWHAVRERAPASPGTLIAWLLLLEALGRIAAAHVIGLNHASDRTAMHLLVLAILVIAFAADGTRARSSWWWCYALLLLPLPLRTLSMANTETMVLCPEQSMPARFIARVEALEEGMGRPAVVAAHRLAGHPWALQRRMRGGEGDANAHSWPRGLSDVLILPKIGLGMAPVGYVLADSATGNQLYLLVHEPLIRTTTIRDTSFTITNGVSDRSPSLALSRATLCDDDLFIEISGHIASLADPLDLRLVVSVLDSAGAVLHNDLILLNTRRECWSGEFFRTIRHVPGHLNAARAEIRFWSPDSAAFVVEDGRLIERTARP